MPSGKRVKGIMVEINGDVTGLDKALKQTNSAINETQRSLKDVQKLLKLDPGNTDLLAQKQRLLADAISKTKEKIDTLKTAQEQAQKQLARGDIGQKQYDALQRELIDTEQELKDLEAAAEGTGGELGDLAKEAGNAADRTGELDVSLKSMIKNAAVNVAVDAMKAIGDKAVEAAKYVIDVGSEFESSMSKVSAISGATGSDFEALSEKAQEMGATTKFSASEAAEAMNYMAMAGWKTEEMLSGIDGVMSLAAASGEDLATTSDIVTDALTAFGLEASKAGELADVIASTSANANTNVSMMGESFKYAAPVAGALGASMQDTSIALGLMANSGIKASQAGTALRTGLSNLAKPTKQMQEYMDKYNIELKKNDDGSVNLRDTMVDLREKMGNLSTTEQAAAASAIFGKEAMSGWLAVINSSDIDFNKLTTAIDSSEGAAKTMADTMQNNLAGSMEIFWSSIEGLGIAIYEQIQKPLQEGIEFATKIISGLTEALRGHRNENDEIVEQIQEATDSVRSSLETASSIEMNTAAQAGQIDVLSTALIELNKQENLNEAQKKRLKEIYDQLVELVPDLAGKYDEETGRVNLTTDAIKNLVTARKEEIIETGKLQALQGIYEELGKAQGELTLALANVSGLEKQRKMWEDLRDRIGQAQSDLNNTFQDMNKGPDLSALEGLREELMSIAQEALNSGAITSSTYEEISKMFDDNWSESELAAAYEKLQANVEETETDIKNASEGIDALNAVYDEASLKAKNLEEALDGTNKKTKEEIGAVKDSANSIDDLNQEKLALKKTTEENATATEEEAKFIDYAKDANEDLRKEVVERQKAEHEAIPTTEEVTEAYEEQIDVIRQNAEAARTQRDAIHEAFDRITETFDSYKTAAENAFSIDVFGGWQQDTEKGMLAFEESMKSQIDGLLMYRDNMSVVRDNMMQISPEFVSALEDMGEGGAQLVAELADCFRTGNTETAQRLVDEYLQVLDIRDGITDEMVQNKLALELGLGGLSEEQVRAWEELGYAFDEGVLVMQAKGEQLTETTSTSFWNAVDAAKSIGLQIPSGLAESIRNSEDPEQAIIQATAVIEAALQSHGQGLLTIADELGISVPANISQSILNGTGDVDGSINELVNLILGKSPEFESAGTAAGEAASDATATGISNKESTVSDAAEGVVGAAKDSAATASELFSLVGGSAMEAMKVGFAEKQEGVSTNLKAHLTVIKNQAKTKAEEIYDKVGEAMVSTIAKGFNDTSPITKALDSLNSTVSSKMQTLVSTVQTAMDNVKNSTNFSWSLPHLQLPHIVTGWDTITYGDGAWVQIPRFSVNWYAKAMDNGMILNNPTIFGMMGNSFLAGGEAGSETVVGTESLMSMIQTAVETAGNTINMGGVTIPVYASQGMDVTQLAEQIERTITQNVIRRAAHLR